MLHIIIGLGIIVAGFMTTWKSEWFLRHFGRVDWAEDHLALEGGTRFFYKMVGIVIIFLGIFVLTGIWTDILRGFVKIFKR
ncbi:hypothetical protein ISS21_02550 [Patescibacteria group bacterium]|nr:hypothetical protein [Patescibacteria group bacterium]